MVEQRGLARPKEARQHRDGQPRDGACVLHEARRLAHLGMGGQAQAGWLEADTLPVRQRDAVPPPLVAQDYAARAVELRPAAQPGDEGMAALG